MQSSVDATMATPDGVGLADRNADHKHSVSRSDVQESFLHDLTHAERLLTVLWYAERMTPAEIGAVLDLSEAEVLATHTRVVSHACGPPDHRAVVHSPVVLASVCAIGMLAFALIGWISMRRAAHTPHATPSESLSVDVPLALGVALGFLGSLVRGSDAPWIAGGGPVAIPIGAASVGLGWALVRSDRVIDGVRTSDAIGLVTCSILLAASVLTDGLGLAEGAAILLALASWSSVRWTQRPHVQSSHPDGHTGIGAMWGLTLLGILGMHLGLSARVAWGIALVGLLGILPAWRTGTSQRELGSVLGLVVITPLSALATASAARVLMAGAAAGHASHLAGDLWIVGFAQSLASRPVAALPGGFVPEMCLIGVALGVGFCAPKLPIWAHRLLGALVGLLGVGIIGLALAS